ncbi:MAG: YciI family protein [Microcystaceae cyanobacterium]
MPWFVKIEQGIVPKDIFDQYVPSHKAYIQELIAQGHQAKTGYWKESEGGMLLFTANSLEEAQKIVEKDPLIANSCVEYQLHQWCIVVE